jgi:hypothetical protein
MSIHGTLNNGVFTTFDCEPAWSKAERLAYCEPYEPQADGVISRVLSSLKAAFVR